MDDYFNLIESYNEANPTMEDGTENIPYTILCDDWRYFLSGRMPRSSSTDIQMMDPVW